MTGESHIPLAATPHYRNAAPISGLASFANVDFDFDMRVERVSEHPRITKPFSEEAWKALDALGEEVDKKLVADDVRLTMGGEPTFVSIDDFEVGRVERGRGRPDQAGARRPADPAPARPLRAGRVPALRAGQMVSGRIPAALDVFALLAARLKPIWQNPERIARGGTANRRQQGDAEALLGAIASRARHRARLYRASLRGSGRVARQGGQSAGERLAGEF